MRRLFVAALLVIGAFTAVRAQEAWCNSNPTNCVCSDVLANTSYSRTGNLTDPNGATYYGNAVGTKPCRFDGDVLSSIAFGYCNGTTFAGNLLIRDSGSDSDSENMMDKLPSGNTVARVLRESSATQGFWCSFRFGFIGMPLTSLASERIAIRWYSYHSSNFEWAGEGSCTNGKIAHNSDGFFADPSITLTIHGGASAAKTTIYGWGNYNGWLWTGGPTTFAGFNQGVGPRPGTYRDVHDYRGNWYRHEIVVEHPRASSSGGYDMHYYVKNITTNTPEFEDVRFSSNCDDCGDFPSSGNDWRWTSGLHPSSDLDALHTEFYKEGTCVGWQAWAYVAVASWTTNAGQRIGAATEVESGGAPDTTAPVRSGGLPTGFLSSGTTSTTISLNTNENATCKYSTTPPTSYASMTTTFSTTGGTSHSQAISGLVDGGSYSYYVRCTDSVPNANIDDYIIVFQVSTPTASPSTLLRGAKLTGGKIP